MSEGVERVVCAAMGVAGPIGQGGQFAKHGAIDRCAQSGLQLRQGGHLVVLEEYLEPVGGEAG